MLKWNYTEQLGIYSPKSLSIFVFRMSALAELLRPKLNKTCLHILHKMNHYKIKIIKESCEEKQNTKLLQEYVNMGKTIVIIVQVIIIIWIRLSQC